MKSIIKRKLRLAAAKVPQTLPEEIHLPALEQSWAVEYRKTASNTVQARVNGNGSLVVSGRVNAGKEVVRALRRWLSRQAKASLIPWIEELSYETGLSFEKVSVRGQRTRWGSCSSKKHINLNWKLLFLSPEVVRYILLHELCHTVQLNHSRRFWSHLAAVEPDYKALNQAAKEGMLGLPGWVVMS